MLLLVKNIVFDLIINVFEEREISLRMPHPLSRKQGIASKI